jgi:hypothetical protein
MDFQEEAIATLAMYLVEQAAKQAEFLKPELLSAKQAEFLAAEAAAEAAAVQAEMKLMFADLDKLMFADLDQ